MSLQVNFCPTRKAEVKAQFDPAGDFSNNRFPSTKSYHPGSSVTFQLANRIYGFIPDAHLLDNAHPPPPLKRRSCLTRNSLKEYDAWSTGNYGEDLHPNTMPPRSL
jgi:hypothetical protein